MRKITAILFLVLIFQFPSLSQLLNIELRDNGNVPAKKEIEITQLDCKTELFGNVQITTYDVTIFSSHTRPMEGRLEFSLENGQQVTRFALDINGSMREGVVVDKSKATRVFEDIERRNVDPGVLESTGGNSYRARIFPVPANGTRRFIIATQHIIPLKAGIPVALKIPLTFGQKIKKAKISCMVYTGHEKPVPSPDNKINFEFNEWTSGFMAEKTIDNFDASTTLHFTIPVQQSNVYTFAHPTGKLNEWYFSATVFPEIKSEISLPVKKLIVYWDASTSSRHHHKEKSELFLQYIQTLKNVEVSIQVFNTRKQGEKNIIIINGETRLVEEYLKTIQYDGATDLSVLNFAEQDADRILFFSDGISTYGEQQVRTGKTPVYCITSEEINDFSYLNYISLSTGGKLFNLKSETANQIIQKLSGSNFTAELLNRDDFSEVYYDLTPLNGEAFTVAGIAKSKDFFLTLHFKNGAKIVDEKRIGVSGNSLFLNHPEVINAAKKIWSLKKMEYLLLQTKKNRLQIVAHSVRHNIVSPYTSLLVLENLEDYVQYKIEPPQEMQKEYYALIEKQDAEFKKAQHEKLNQVIEMYDRKIKWWEVHYDDTIKKVDYEIWQKKLAAQRARTRDSVLAIRADSVRAYNREHGIVENEVQISAYRMEMSMSSANRSERLVETQALTREEVSVGFANPTPGLFDKKDKIELKAWDSTASYIREIKKQPREKWYDKYLALREEYISSPSYFIECAFLFAEAKEMQTSELILSNLAEIKTEDHTLLRSLAHRLLQMNECEKSIWLFEKVKDLRNYEPQSYRDLGLAYARCKKYQMAIDSLYVVVERSWNNRFPEIENIVLTEMNDIISTCGQKLNITRYEPRLLKSMPSDVRVIINWSSDNCDIDLWVTDPYGEKCMYNHALTRIGGRMSRDFTGGYGPEEFMAHYAAKGKYKIEAHYYGERSPSILGPATLTVQLYTNYGKPNQQVKEITRKLEKKGENIYIGDFEIK